MAKLFHCRFCMVEIEALALADGSAALICVDCDVIGLAHEVARGAAMWRAGLRRKTAPPGQRRQSSKLLAKMR
jgi:hypothetical protein